MNSDTSMVGVLEYWDVVGVPTEHVTCRLQIHRTADVAGAEGFWKEVVGEGDIWMRTMLKRHNAAPSRHNRDGAYRGCLAITVRQSAADYRRFAGTWEGVAAAVRGGPSPVV